MPLARIHSKVDIAQALVGVTHHVPRRLALDNPAGTSLTQGWVPRDVAVDQRVGGGGRVGDDLGDHLVVVRPAVVVVQVGRKVDLLSGDPLIKLIGTAGYRRVG